MYFTKPMRPLSVIVVFLCLIAYSKAQSGQDYFDQARKFAAMRELDSTLSSINKACLVEETNLDYRLYRARVYAWRQDFSTSFSEIDYVLEKYPQYREAELLKMDNYLAQQAWSKMDTYVANLLNLNPQKLTAEDNLYIRKRYAMGLMEQGRNGEAVRILNPVQNEVLPLWQEAKNNSMNKTITAHYRHFQLNGEQPDWNVYELGYMHRLSKLTYIASLNRASRFNSVGNQLLMELYPRIGKRAYAWLMGGLSSGITYPKSFYGASLFGYATKYIELEAGARFIQLPNDPLLKILRGGIVFDNDKHRIGYHVSDVYSKTGSGFTHILFYQNYFKKDGSYWRIGGAKGSNINNLLTAQLTNFTINSYVGNANMTYVFNRHWRVLMGLTYEKYTNVNLDTRKNRWIYDIGTMYKF